MLNEVKYTYDGWGLVQKSEQDRDSAVTGGGNQYYVSFNTVKSAPAGGRQALRRAGVNYSGHGLVSYAYTVPSGGFNNEAGRVGRVSFTPRTGAFAVALADYQYMGVGTLVGTDLPQPSVRRDLSENAVGGDKYPDLDRWGRVVESRWTSYKGTGPKDFYSVTLGYDSNSNITSAQDHVHTTGWGGTGDGLWDVKYEIDELNRVVGARVGHLSGGAITIPKSDEAWTLSQTGNHLLYLRDRNGDLDYSDSGELQDAQTFSLANELRTRDTDNNASVNYTLAHDKPGNLTDDGKSYTYVYDGLYRLKEIRDRSSNALVVEYAYNGLNQRISWREGSAGTWFHALHDDRWRVVGVYRASDTYPKQQFVYHAAGRDGLGGSSYIDAVICRERDANTGAASASDGTLEERVYYCQNQRADVVAVLSSAGSLIESARYSVFGVPFGMPAGDTDSDGDYDATDKGNITGTYDIRKDIDLDGDVDAADVTAAGGTGTTLGWGVLTKTGTANRVGYAGYRHEAAVAGVMTLCHLRNRDYWADQGRLLRRDPAGYVDGMSLYAYVQNMAVIAVDPYGLWGNDVALTSDERVLCGGRACINYGPNGKSSGTGSGSGFGPGGGPGSGSGSGPPACGGGTCGTPIGSPVGRSKTTPIICAGALCTTPPPAMDYVPCRPIWDWRKPAPRLPGPNPDRPHNVPGYEWEDYQAPWCQKMCDNHPELAGGTTCSTNGTPISCLCTNKLFARYGVTGLGVIAMCASDHERLHRFQPCEDFDPKNWSACDEIGPHSYEINCLTLSIHSCFQGTTGIDGTTWPVDPESASECAEQIGQRITEVRRNLLNMVIGCTREGR